MSVSTDVLEVAERDVAEGRAPSLSAWVNEAMEAKARRENLKDLLAEIRQSIGPATKEETAWARSVLGL